MNTLTVKKVENVIEHYRGAPASAFAEALEVQDVRALCDLALQALARQEAAQQPESRDAERFMELLGLTLRKHGFPDYDVATIRADLTAAIAKDKP